MAVILLGSTYLLVREYLLYQGTREFRGVLLDLDRSRVSGTLQEECLERTAGGLDGDVVEYFVRFTSDHKFEIEAYCTEFSFDPRQLGRGELHPFVTKLPGSSGVLFGEEPSFIELTAFEPELLAIEGWTGWNLDLLRRSRAIGVEGNRLKEFVGALPDYTVGPATSCTGYGYVCCDRETQVGTGELLASSVECDGGCYGSCMELPSVVALTPSPYFEPDSREIRISAGNIANFAYVVQSGSYPVTSVNIEYGDGAVESSTEVSGMFSHAYTCPTESCRYTAIITAVDERENRSAVTLINRVDVLVAQERP